MTKTLHLLLWAAILAGVLTLRHTPASGEELTPDAVTRQGELEDFIPSEKLPADRAISFPVDI